MKKKTNWFKRSTRIVGMNPITFEEWWRVRINRLQLISIILLLVIILFSFNYVIFAYTPVGKLLPENIKNRNKEKIEATAIRVLNMEQKIKMQDRYISNLQRVILGEISIDSVFMEEDFSTVELSVQVDTTTSEAEKELNRTLKLQAERANETQGKLMNQLLLFDPVAGEISRRFQLPDHPGVDIVSEKGSQIKACLEGTVLHADYSDQDGFTVIIRHKSEITSIYKHAESVFVKAGDKVKTGQAIGIIGNTGERSTGPHLHFELWSEIGPINPADYFSFGK